MNAEVNDNYFDDTEKVRKEYTRRIRRLYNKCNPDKLSEIPKLLKKYDSNLHTLYLSICKKYKQKPEKEFKPKKSPGGKRGKNNRPGTREKKNRKKDKTPSPALTPAALPPHLSTPLIEDVQEEDELLAVFPKGSASPMKFDEDSIAHKVFQNLPQTFSVYEQRFCANGVDDELLLDLHDQDLEELGVCNSVHRKRIFKEVRKCFREKSYQQNETLQLETWCNERNLSSIYEGLVKLDISRPETLWQCSRSDIDNIAEKLELEVGVKLRFKRAIQESKAEQKNFNLFAGISQESESVMSENDRIALSQGLQNVRPAESDTSVHEHYSRSTAEFTSKISNLEAQLSTLRKENEGLQSKLEMQVQKTNQSETQFNVAKAASESFEKSINDLKQELKSEKESLNQIRAKKLTKEGDHQRIEMEKDRKIGKLEDEVERVQKQMADLKDENMRKLESIKDDYERKLGDLAESHQRSIELYEKKIELLDMQILNASRAPVANPDPATVSRSTPPKISDIGKAVSSPVLTKKEFKPETFTEKKKSPKAALVVEITSPPATINKEAEEGKRLETERIEQEKKLERRKRKLEKMRREQEEKQKQREAEKESRKQQRENEDNTETIQKKGEERNQEANVVEQKRDPEHSQSEIKVNLPVSEAVDEEEEMDADEVMDVEKVDLKRVPSPKVVKKDSEQEDEWEDDAEAIRRMFAQDTASPEKGTEMSARERKRLERQKQRETEEKERLQAAAKAEKARIKEESRLREEEEKEKRKRDHQKIREKERNERAQKRMSQSVESKEPLAPLELELLYKYESSFANKGLVAHPTIPNQILCHSGKVATMFDCGNKEAVKTYKFGKTSNCCGFDPTGTFLFSVGKGDVAYVRDVTTGSLHAKYLCRLKKKEKEKVFKEMYCGVASVNSLFAGGRDKEVLRWDFENTENLYPVARYKHGELVTALFAFGDFILSGGPRGRVIVWNLETQKRIITLRSLSEIKVIFADNERVMSAGKDGQIVEFSMKSGNKLRNWIGGGDSLNRLFVSPGRTHVMNFCTYSFTIRDYESSKILQEMPMEDAISSAAASQTGGTLTVSCGGILFVYRMKGFGRSFSRQNSTMI